jgi:hypothetical protein
MLIRKQRLLTPGPTPLYPPAVLAMAAADIHHRTEDFRKLSKQVIADLKYFMGTANDVLLLTSSGSGAMESAVSNLFSPGDKVLVATAGKFGERWVQMTRAFGLDVSVVEEPYGQAVSPGQVADALKADPAIEGVFVQATESSTGVSHDVKSMAEAVRETDAIFIADAITGLGTSEIDIDGWGVDIVVGGSQKALMIPPGLAFMSVSQKAWKRAETAKNRYFYFDMRKHRDTGAKGESPWRGAEQRRLRRAATRSDAGRRQAPHGPQPATSGGRCRLQQPRERRRVQAKRDRAGGPGDGAARSENQRLRAGAVSPRRSGGHVLLPGGQGADLSADLEKAAQQLSPISSAPAGL